MLLGFDLNEGPKKSHINFYLDFENAEDFSQIKLFTALWKSTNICLVDPLMNITYYKILYFVSLENKLIFFLSGFSFTNIHELQDWRGREERISLTPHYHFHSLRRQLDINRAITEESSPLQIACSRTRTGNLWLSSAHR